MAEVRFKGRIAVLAVVVLLVFAAVGGRLALLHLRPADWVLEPIAESRMFEWNPAANRGRIVDRNNRILAMDTPAYHVYADPKYIAEHGDADTVCKYLSMEFRMPEAEIREILSDTTRQYKVLKKYVPGNQLRRFKRRNLKFSTGGSKGCLAGQLICLIDVDGEVLPCSYFPKSAGNINQVPFKKIWEESELFLKLRDFKGYKDNCGRCEYVNVCGGCRARAYAMTGDYLAQEPFCSYQPGTK